MTEQTQDYLLKNAYATLIVSGQKQPLCIAGLSLVHDIRQAIYSFLRSTAKPRWTSNGVDWYDNWFEIDEFCVTFLDWVRVHDDSVSTESRIARDSLIDFLSDKCIEQTVMFIEGIASAREYDVYQSIVNLLHLGTDMETAKRVTQRELGLIVFTNADHLLHDKN